MPERRHLHCVVAYNESTAIIFGGGNKINGSDLADTYVNYFYWNVRLDELHSGFFMHFPDPTNPFNVSTSEVSYNNYLEYLLIYMEFTSRFLTMVNFHARKAVVKFQLNVALEKILKQAIKSSLYQHMKLKKNKLALQS